VYHNKIPEGKSRVSIQFRLKPNPTNKTFIPQLEAKMPNNMVLLIDMETKGIKQIHEMIEEYERKGWRPAEEKEEEQSKQA